MKLKCSCHCILVKCTCAYFLMKKLTFQTEISLAVHPNQFLSEFSILCFTLDEKYFCVTLFYIDLLARSGFSKVIFKHTLSTKQKILDIHFFTVLHPQFQPLAKTNVLSYAYIELSFTVLVSVLLCLIYVFGML